MVAIGKMSVEEGVAMQIALLASRRLRQGPLSPLVRFTRDFLPFLEQHKILTSDGCYRALRRAGITHPNLCSVGAGYQGALVEITSGVVPDENNQTGLDIVIYFVDPRDPSSNFPETNALKRECVVHKKPFLATTRSAYLWANLTWRDEPDSSFLKYTDTQVDAPGQARLMSLKDQNLALIAHDNKKAEMLEFAIRHFDFLLQFGSRVGTGTTGTLLNGDKPGKLDPAQWKILEPLCLELKNRIQAAQKAGSVIQFVKPYRSGPEGGDVQIAKLVLEDRCQALVFFEDPSIPRQHEQDIQLLERTGRTRGKRVLCVHDPLTADDLATKWAKGEISLLSTALQRRFGVKAIVVPSSQAQKETWKNIREAATWFLLSQVAALASDFRRRNEFVRLTVSWGEGLAEIVDGIEPIWRSLMEEENRLQEKESAIIGLSDPRYLRPGNVIVGPLQGMMAAAEDRIEANSIARRLASFFGGQPLGLARAALRRRSESETPEDDPDVMAVQEHWDRTDVLVTTCAQVRKEYAGKVAPDFDAHYDEVKSFATGDFGGIYLAKKYAMDPPCGDSGRNAWKTRIYEPKYFARRGMSGAQMQKVLLRGGQTVLVSGAQEERLEIAQATIATGLFSVLITDLDFARRLLDSK